MRRLGEGIRDQEKYYHYIAWGRDFTLCKYIKLTFLFHFVMEGLFEGSMDPDLINNQTRIKFP